MGQGQRAEGGAPGGAPGAAAGVGSGGFLPTDRVIAEVRQACVHFADLYFHFAKVLRDELGAERAQTLIERAVRNRAEERAKAMRREALARDLPLTVEGWRQVTDIPLVAWDHSRGRLACPYAAAWLPRFAANPWFQPVARRYCEVNDPEVTRTFTGDTTQRITRNVLAGDGTCDREYFAIREGGEGA